MSTRELIEQAVLDALGLLEEDEARAFEDAFNAAAPEVREQVRTEQARLADVDMLLPPVRPRPELRERVLAAVRREIASEPVHGGRSAERAVRHDHRRGVPAMVSSRRVSRFWRATSIGLMVALIVVVVVGFRIQDDIGRLHDRPIANVMLETMGAERFRAVLFDDGTHRVSLAPADAAFRGEAAVWYHRDWGDNALLVYRTLPSRPDGQYRLVAIDENDEIIEELASFESDGQVGEIEVSVALLTDRRLAIFLDGDGASRCVLRASVAFQI